MRSRWQGAALILVLIGLLPAPASCEDVVDPVPALRRARELWDDGSLRRALRALETAHAPDLADHIGLLRLRLLHAQGRLPDALKAGEQALAGSPPSEVRARILEELAQVHLGLEDLSAAYAAQRGAWEASRDPATQARLRLAYARELEKRERPAEALRLYDELWSALPLADESVDAYARSLFISDALGSPKPEAQAVLDRGRRLSNAFQCGVALPLYDEVLARPDLDPLLRPTAERGRADCLFQRRRYPEAAEIYTALAKASPDDVDSAIFAARSHGRAGQSEQAVKELLAIARRAPPPDAAQAKYLAADLLPGRGKKAADARHLFLEVAAQGDNPALAKLAAWRIAWEDFREGRRAAALERLQTLAIGSKWDIEVQRARYWAAVAQLELDPAQGRKGLEEMARDLPLSYYGLLAAERLGSAPQIERSFLGARPALPAVGPALRARWLMAAGFEDGARAEVASWVLGERLSPQDRLAAAPLLHALGLHFEAARLIINGFGDSLDQGIDPAWSDAWREAWPAPFGLSVRDASEEFGLGTALVYAIMREESLYRPEVESTAGARGLMQLTPPTAQKLAGSLRVEPFDPNALYTPTVNVRLGTFYLTQLLARFNGSRHQAVAAYNAGPQIVEPWNAEYGPLAEDAFVDSVPYAETRRYLRRVLRSYRMYQILYASSAAPTEIRASR